MRAAWLVIFLMITLCFVAAGKAQLMSAEQTAQTTAETAASQPEDSVEFISVKTKDDAPIQRGKLIDMKVTVHYTLVSVKSAKLSLGIAQFHDSRCKVNGDTPTSAEKLIHKGSKTVTFSVTWPGDTGMKSKGRVIGSGSLSFTAILWNDNGGGFLPTTPREQYGVYPFSNDYCAAF
jgi:hypothetical protein